jgi:hypothetical protein
MHQQKLAFITSATMPLLNTLSANTKGKWGKMNAQQMVEHLADFFKISTGNIKFKLVIPEADLHRLKAFLYSDKEFRENTKAPVLPEDPLPVRNAAMALSLLELQNEITLFTNLYTADSNLTTTHPVFGDLNFEEWILLHHKHLTHHLKQFDLV